MPFRTQHDEPSLIEQDRVLAKLVAFGLSRTHYELVWEAPHGLCSQSIDRTSSEVSAVFTLPLDGLVYHSLQTSEGLRAFVTCDKGAGFWNTLTPQELTEPTNLPGFENDTSTSATVIVDEHPALVYTSQGEQSDRGLRLRVVSETLDPVWNAWIITAPTSRKLLTVVPFIRTTMAILSTDRPDEIDLCSLDAHPVRSTISLGRHQSFVGAAGGAGKVMVVSRGERDLVARTVAQDMRTELNATPIVPRSGWTVGAAFCAFAGGPFVLVHNEHNEQRGLVEAVVTLFGDGDPRSTRFASVAVSDIYIEGRTLFMAGMLGGVTTPLLAVQKLTILRRQNEWLAAEISGSAGTHRRYLFPLLNARCTSQQHRRMVLHDVAETLALSLGAAAPQDPSVIPVDDRSDRMHFWLQFGTTNELSLSILVREDGSGIATIKLGRGEAPEARSLSFGERLKQLFTGDDDGDPNTTRVEISVLHRGVEEILRAAWGLRTVSDD